MADDSYQPKVYMEQGGDRQVVKSGGSMDVESGGEIDVESGGELKLAGVAIAASAAEINRAADASARIVDVTTATLALTEALHDGKVLTANRAAGITFTLPAASGSGAKFTIIVGTTITSNDLIVQVVTDDVMTGWAELGVDTDTTSVMFGTAADSDTITMNGSTKGGIKGNIIELVDIAADLWSVRVQGIATGAEATPFSAAVS